MSQSKRQRKDPWDKANNVYGTLRPLVSKPFTLTKDGVYGVTVEELPHAACVYNGKLYDPNDYERSKDKDKNFWFVAPDEKRPLLARTSPLNIGKTGACSLIAASIYKLLSRRNNAWDDDRIINSGVLEIVHAAALVPQHLLDDLYAPLMD